MELYLSGNGVIHIKTYNASSGFSTETVTIYFTDTQTDPS